MQEINIHVTFWLLTVGCWLWLYRQGRLLGLARAYPLLYAYIGAAAVSETSMLLARYVLLDPYVYAYLYLALSVGILGLSMAVMLWAYFLFDRPRWRRDWHFLLVPAVLVVIELQTPRGDLWPWYRLINVTFATSSYFAIAALAKRAFSRQVAMGWNVSMVVLAFTLPGALHALGEAAGFSATGGFPALVWTRLTALASWIILSVGMAEYSPPHRVSVEGLSLEEANFRMKRTIHLLWNFLRH